MARDQVECSKVQRRARVIVVDADYSYLRLVKDALKRSGVSIEVEFEGGEDRVVSVDETCEIRVRESLLVNGGRPIPLASGELNLLLYLSTPRGVWRQTRELAAVLGRADEAGRTLVWQYMSRVKSKLGSAAAALEHARNRGYRIRPALRD